MARKLRSQFPGAIYHVINRGNYRRDEHAILMELASLRECGQRVA